MSSVLSALPFISSVFKFSITNRLVCITIPVIPDLWPSDAICAHSAALRPIRLSVAVNEVCGIFAFSEFFFLRAFQYTFYCVRVKFVSLILSTKCGAKFGSKINCFFLLFYPSSGDEVVVGGTLGQIVLIGQDGHSIHNLFQLFRRRRWSRSQRLCLCSFDTISRIRNLFGTYVQDPVGRLPNSARSPSPGPPE